MSAQILSFLNFKGGVAKTTDTVNIAAAMALHPQIGGKRVLIVDLDPQCNSTLWLVGREVYRWVQERDQTVHEIFRRSLNKLKPDLTSLIHPVDKSELSGGRLDLLPGSFSCLKLEEDPKMLDDNNLAHLVLTKALDTIKNQYDYILLDCPPSWSVLTRNALRAAHHVLIPYTPDYLALEGILWMRQLHEEFSQRVGIGNIARLTGIIVNRVRNAANHQYVNAHQQAISELGQVIEQLHQKHGYRLHVFQPHIAETSAVAEAINYQEHLLHKDMNHPVTRQFSALTQDIMMHLRILNPRVVEAA
jgi:chromosome partitioning protein